VWRHVVSSELVAASEEVGGVVYAANLSETSAMDAQHAPAAHWPPRVGDYARVRRAGILGEVISVQGQEPDRRFTLNLFEPAANEPLVYQFDDLEPVWDSPPAGDAGQTWDAAPDPRWATSWPSWTR
jgi:hypothetical protein